MIFNIDDRERDSALRALHDRRKRNLSEHEIFMFFECVSESAIQSYKTMTDKMMHLMQFYNDFIGRAKQDKKLIVCFQAMHSHFIQTMQEMDLEVTEISKTLKEIEDLKDELNKEGYKV